LRREEFWGWFIKKPIINYTKNNNSMIPVNRQIRDEWTAKMSDIPYIAYLQLNGTPHDGNGYVKVPDMQNEKLIEFLKKSKCSPIVNSDDNSTYELMPSVRNIIILFNYNELQLIVNACVSP